MRVLLYLLTCCIGSAATLHEQLLEVARGVDRVELVWRSNLHVERAGVTPLKKVYLGPAIEVLMARLQFEKDFAAPEQEPAQEEKGELTPEEELMREEGKILRVPNCLCTGTNLLRFFSNGRLTAQVAYLHGMKLRSLKIDEGCDARLTEASQEWLKKEASWYDDIAKLEEFEKRNKEPNHAAEPTPTAGTSAAEQSLVPAAVVAHP